MKGARKRKADELDDEPRDGSNGAQPPKHDLTSAQDALPVPAAEMVYRVKTAVAPLGNKKPHPRLFQGKAEIAHDFSTEYQIFGGEWGAMKNYKKISCTSPLYLQVA